MLNKISLSFIVPVYNVEKYILDCLKSIAFQTCDEYEIIFTYARCFVKLVYGRRFKGNING